MHLLPPASDRASLSKVISTAQSALPHWMELFNCCIVNGLVFSVLDTEFLPQFKAKFISTARPFHILLYGARFYCVGAAADTVLSLFLPSSPALPKARAPARRGDSGTDPSALGTPRVCCATFSPNFSPVIHFPAAFQTSLLGNRLSLIYQTIRFIAVSPHSLLPFLSVFPIKLRTL